MEKNVHLLFWRGGGLMKYFRELSGGFSEIESKSIRVTINIKGIRPKTLIQAH
jgi:hypothetical protein